MSGMALSSAAVQPYLQEWFPHASSTPTLRPLVADASTRRYFRLAWPTTHPQTPASCVLMLCEPWDPKVAPDFLAVGQHLRACGVRVPQVYGVAPAQGYMALEDFGDCTLATYWQQPAVTDRLPWGQRAVDELIKMHTRGTWRYHAACPAFRLAFDVPKLLSELQFFRQHAVEGLWQQSLPEAERDEFDAACTPLCALLAEQPRFFCHRDYHGWNLMVQAGTLGVLDFQDARLGPQPYDLVSLLVDRGMPGVLGPEVSQALCDYYRERMAALTGIHSDRAAFAELFDYVAVQRCLKAIGTFAYMTMVRQRPQYRPYIEPTLAYIAPHLHKYTPLHPLARFLRRYIPWPLGVVFG